MSYEEQNIYNRKHPAEISGSLIVQWKLPPQWPPSLVIGLWITLYILTLSSHLCTVVPSGLQTMKFFIM
jgi:hypothetical protein